MAVVYILLGLVAAVLVFLEICNLAVDPKKKYEKDSPFYRGFLSVVAKAGAFFAGIKPTVTGLDKLPRGKKLLFVCNHLSSLDPFVAFNALKEYKTAFISKPENFRVPFVGRSVRKCCFLPIDRENPRNAITTIVDAGALLKNQEVSVFVYPEGTRSRTGELLPFHGGVFKIAQKGQTEIAVTRIKNTDAVRKNFPLKRTKVTFEVLDVIPLERVLSERSEALSDYARELIKTAPGL